MARLLYGLPLDNLLLQAVSITVTNGTVVTGFGVDRLYDGLLAKPLAIEETDLDVVFEFAAPVVPQFPSIGHSNLDVAAHLQGHTSNSWSSPDIDVAFAVPTVSVDGFFSNPYLDNSALAAKAWWRLHITGNALPIKIGELFLGSTLRSLPKSYEYTSTPTAAGGSVVHETNFGAELAYTQSTRREAIEGSVLVTNAGLALVQALIEACRFRARPLVMVPVEGETDAWWVRLLVDQVPKPRPGSALHRVSLPVRQLTRGLPWIDPDE